MAPKDLVKLLLYCAIPMLMLAQGARLTPAHVRAFVTRPTLVARAVLSVIVLVPLAVLAVVIIVGPEREVAVGLALLSCVPGAPLLLPTFVKLGRSVPYGAGMYLVLAAISVFTAPIVLAAFSLAPSFYASIPPLDVAQRIATLVLVPVIVGYGVSKITPAHASTIASVLEKISTLTLLVVVALVFYRFGSVLLQMSPRSYLAMALAITAALTIGHLLAPPTRDERTLFALESAGRNPGLAALIATLNFGGTRIIAVLLPYLLVFFVLTQIYRLSRRAVRVQA